MSMSVLAVVLGVGLTWVALEAFTAIGVTGWRGAVASCVLGVSAAVVVIAAVKFLVPA